MALHKYRLKKLIAQRREKNDGFNVPVKGVTSDGFINPKQPDADTRLYNVFYRGDFVFNPARMEVNSIAFNREYQKAICSSLYEVFYVSRPDILNPEYLNLFVKRYEFARHCMYIGWGSAREYCRVSNIGEIEIELPSLDIQRKYVAIYEAMLKNQQAYEHGLEDLKIAVESLYDKCKHEGEPSRLGGLLTEVDVRNTNMLPLTPMGISMNHQFQISRAEIKDRARYKLVQPGQMAVNLIHVGRDAAYPIALNQTDQSILVSPDYWVLRAADDDKAQYLMGWFSRAEVGRHGWFICDVDIRGRLSFDKFLDLRIPLPDNRLLRSVANLRRGYQERVIINERLKSQLKDICPVLIKGSIEEASR